LAEGVEDGHDGDGDVRISISRSKCILGDEEDMAGKQIRLGLWNALEASLTNILCD